MMCVQSLTREGSKDKYPLIFRALFMTWQVIWSQSRSNIQDTQMKCGNLKPSMYKNTEWTLQWRRRHLVSCKKNLRNQHKFTFTYGKNSVRSWISFIANCFMYLQTCQEGICQYYDSLASQQDLFLGCALFPAWNTSLKIPQSSGNAITWWESWSGYLEVWMSSHKEEYHFSFIIFFFFAALNLINMILRLHKNKLSSIVFYLLQATLSISLFAFTTRLVLKGFLRAVDSFMLHRCLWHLQLWLHPKANWFNELKAERWLC